MIFETRTRRAIYMFSQTHFGVYNVRQHDVISTMPWTGHEVIVSSYTFLVTSLRFDHITIMHATQSSDDYLQYLITSESYYIHKA